jgi:hypothetical protein
MFGAERVRWMALGLSLALATISRAPAQDVAIAPPPAPAASGVSPDAAPAASGAPSAIAPDGTTVPGCSCGDRWGFSRWRYHKAHCKRVLQDYLIGYGEEFNEWPLGYALYAHAKTQVNNGRAAHMTFYHYDFEDGTSRLNYRGRDKLVRIGTHLPTNFAPVVVERTPKEPGLDESRRQVVLAQLGRGPFPVPAERVVIGPSLANGITGVEAMYIYANQRLAIGSGGALAGGVAGVAGFVGGPGTFSGEGLSGSAITAVPR